MRIIIDYESSWRNSFLDGDNNSALPKNGREYLGSMTTLKKEGNFIERKITKDTVMGVMNRLIGDQRKLYQAKNSMFEASYYFSDIEQHITFFDNEKMCTISNEIVYIRNMKGSTDQNSFTGMIKTSDPMFSSNYTQVFWGILALDVNELSQFILNKNYIVEKTIVANPLSICDRLEELQKVKALIMDDFFSQVLEELSKAFPEIDYLNNKGDIMVLSLYCSALYLQIRRISDRYDMTVALTKSGGISGISKRGFTKKDFMDRYTTGKKKILWGNPFMKKERVKGEGEVTSMLTKASGQLEITIDITKEKGHEIKQLIENAGVSSFYLGKKGLAFVREIRI